MVQKSTIKRLLLTFVVGVLLSISAYCAMNDYAVCPPGDPSGTGTSLSGTTRTISGVVPGDWGECNMVSNPPFGYLSNEVRFAASQTRFTYSIRLSTPLSNGTYTMPASALKYLFSYVYDYYGLSDPRNGEGTGGKTNYQTYTDFSAGPTQIYYASPTEVPAFPDTVVSKFQFKYAISVPNNTPPGTYNGVIQYDVTYDGGSTFTATCPIQVTVGSIFKLAIDRGNIDFEKMRPGETKDNTPVEGVIITSTSSSGNPWYLKISNDNPLSSGPNIISNNNLIWYGWSDGTGRWYGNGEDRMSLVPMLMYSGSLSEGNNLPDGTKNHLKFKLTIPRGQASGRYMSTVRLTLTE